jgi:signal transduction histidine kinase
MIMRPSDKTTDTPRKIIIIDDNPDIHKDFATILTTKPDLSQLESLEYELFGLNQPARGCSGPRFELDFACQGQEGVQKIKLALAQQVPYQLAFVDMRMPPGWDGLKTIKEIWRTDPMLQVVLCTAYSDYSWEDINQRLGNTDNLLVLKKPFDASEVSQMSSTLTQKWILAKEAEMKRDELERLVGRRTQDLKDSYQRLKAEMAERQALEDQIVRFQKMDAIGSLAAGVAHDLNNILSGILSYPDLLLMKMEKDDPMYRPLSIIRKSARKAAAIVQDMLTLARRNVAVKEPLDLSAVVREFLDSPECRTILDYQPDVTIVPQYENDLPLLLGSSVHLEKLVMNLVLNAAESMNDGGTIFIDMSCVPLTDLPSGYNSINKGDYIKLTVTDQGMGIDQDDLDHIFEPFFTKKKLGRSGTGLGMTVVWDTVNHHDGYIEVSSKKGHGTTICVYFPITDKSAVADDTVSLREDIGGRGERILIVDDLAEQREIATAIFQELGYVTDAVSSGESALEYLESQPVDVLLLDMIMDPGIDGLETFERVLSKYPGQKVVIASGYTKNERIRSALQLGATFVHKPYRFEEIARAVKNTLHSN